MSVKYENEIGMEYVLQKPEGEDDPDSFFFSSHDVGEEVDEIPAGYEIYEDPENEPFLVPEGKNPVPEEEVTALENELERIDHLNEYPGQCHVESFDNSIRVYLLDQTPEAIVDVISALPEEGERILEEISEGNATYTANMKFDRGKNGENYYVDRRVFSGIQKRDEEKWLYVASEESITEAASKYLPHLEQDSFFELGI
ncbi:MAG: hypothetical protein ABEJ25_05765 [Candidatus Bipolaricaulia bacterium]